MEISNLYDDLSSAEIQERATPVGQQLRVAVTKTSAQGKAAQSATPNLMSFSTDENSIWFNGKKYGVYILKGFENLSANSNTGTIQSFLGDFTYDKWATAINAGNIVYVSVSDRLVPASVFTNGDGSLTISINYENIAHIVTITYSTGSGYAIDEFSKIDLVYKTEIKNVLTDSSIDKPLSAAMGKKLQDEKLAKTDVVNNLTTTDTSKALSAAQGKALNDKFNGNKININFSATSNSTDNATIKGYMGNIDGTTLVNKLTYGANLVDSSSEDWVITLQEVSATKVLFTGIRFTSFTVYSKNISVTISGSNYTNMTVAQGSRLVPAINNTLTSTSTSEALSAAQGKALNDKISTLGSVYRVKGSKTNISEVLALTDAKVGDVWSVTNAFTFGGKPYPANTNVVCLVATSTSDHDENNWDPIGGTVDLSPYAKKTEVEESDNEIWEQLSVVVNKDEIVNNLTSTNTNKPLSAAMGKKLQDEKLSKTEANNTYAKKSDVSYTTDLPDSLVVPQTIGGINKGTKVSDLEGSTISQMFDNLLFPEVQPTVQAPSATISFKNTFSSDGVYEVGATAPTAANFNTSFNRGTCTVVGQANKNRAGNLDSGNSFIYYGGNTSTTTFPAKVTLGTMQYNYHAAYAQGDTLVTSKGNKASVTPNPLPAGSVNSGNLTISGTYPYYCNGQNASSSSGDSNFPTSATPDTKLPLYKWTVTLVGAKFASEAATGTRMQFMYSSRKNVTKVEFYNTISGKWETFSTSNYNAKSGTKTYSVQGTNETYNILTTTGPLSGNVQYRFTMANA